MAVAIRWILSSSIPIRAFESEYLGDAIPEHHQLAQIPSSVGMFASLIVCTRDRAHRLPAFLASLDSVDFADADLVLVDNASRDGTGAHLREWARDRRNVQVVSEPVPGLGRARNTGWRISRGEIAIFTDDDCYPAPDFLGKHAELFRQDAALGWASGRILLHDPMDAPVTIQESTLTVRFPSRRFLPTGAVHGANISFRRSALEAIRGFDPRMGAGTGHPCEDIDAAARASFAGWDGVYSPSPVVSHHHGRRGEKEVADLLRNYMRGRGHYYAKALSERTMRSAYLRAVLGKWFHQPKGEVATEAAAMVRWYLRGAWS